MDVIIRDFAQADLPQMIEIWNQVVNDADAFPQLEPLTGQNGLTFFQTQSRTAVACDAASGQIVGLYILHPNNVGRCGHICNASYAVKKGLRGQHIGQKLVRDCIETARRLGFGVLQFNAVVRTNRAALRLYDRLGFVRLGVIPKGFLCGDGHYEDIVVCYYPLWDGAEAAERGGKQ